MTIIQTPAKLKPAVPADERADLIAALKKAQKDEEAEAKKVNAAEEEAEAAVAQHEYTKLLAARDAAKKAKHWYFTYRHGRLKTDLTQRIRARCPVPISHAMRMLERELKEIDYSIQLTYGGARYSGSEPIGYSLPISSNPLESQELARGITDRLRQERQDRREGLQKRQRELAEARRTLDQLCLEVEWEEPLKALLERVKPTFLNEELWAR